MFGVIRNKRKLKSANRRSWKSEFMAIGAASLKVFLSERDLKSGIHLVMKQDLHNQRSLALRSWVVVAKRENTKMCIRDARKKIRRKGVMMMKMMMTGTSLYNSDVFISHCDFYEWLAVNLKELCLLYVFFNELHYLLRCQVYTLVNANTFPASPGSLWDSCSVLFKLGADISDISILAFNNLSIVFINEHYTDGCLSLPCFLKKYIVVLPWW